MTAIHLDDYEEDLVRFLAKHYNEKGEVIAYRDFPHFDELGQDKIQQIAGLFRFHGWLTGHSSEDATILPIIREVIDELDHPPPKDYWKGLITWFRSKWWSIPFLVVALVLPLLFHWAEMVKTFLQWMRNS